MLQAPTVQRILIIALTFKLNRNGGADGGADANAPALRHNEMLLLRSAGPGVSSGRGVRLLRSGLPLHARRRERKRPIVVPVVQFLLHAVQARRGLPAVFGQIRRQSVLRAELSSGIRDFPTHCLLRLHNAVLFRPVLSWAPLQQRPPPLVGRASSGVRAPRRRETSSNSAGNRRAP